jgi:hypothetical protein
MMPSARLLPPCDSTTVHPLDWITDTLSALRRRLNRRDAGEAAWASTLAACIGILVGLSSSLVLGPEYGHWGWLPLITGACGVGAAQWQLSIRPRRQRESDVSLARWLERQRPDLRSGVITAVQARAAINDDTPWPGLNPSLVDQSAVVTVGTLKRIDLDSLVDQRRLTQWMRWGLFAILITCTATIHSPELTRRAVDNLLRGSTDAGGPGDHVHEVEALVTDLAITLEFPAYLQRQRRHIPRTGGDFSATTGTRVTLTGHLAEATENLMLELESDPAARWPVELSDSGIMRVQMQVGTSDRYRFSAATAGGLVFRERGWRVVDARDDQAPLVRMLLPERDLEVNPTDEVPMVYEASDDHGLGPIALVIQRRDGGDAVRQAVREGHGERTTNGTTTLDVAGLRLLPGEAVDVWFEALDQNTVTSPGRGQSGSKRITIYSPEAEHAERLTELGAIIDALILLLAERLESPVTREEPPKLEALVAIQSTIARATTQVIRGLETLVGAMSTDTLASTAMLDSVRAILDALGAHHELEEAQLRLLSTSRGAQRRPKQVLKVLTGHNDEGVSIIERAAWTLKELVEEARQRQVLAQGRDLLDAQQALMKEIAAMKASGQEGLSLEARRTLDELEATLRRMEDELGKLVERSPYENQNTSQEPSGDEQDVRSLRDRLAEVRDLMAQGKHDEAMKLMEEIQRETQELMAALQGDFDLQAPQEQTSEALTEFDLKLGELTSEQAGLTGETEEEERQLEAEQRAALETQLKEAMDHARELAQELEAAADAVDTAPLHNTDREALQTLRAQSKEAREAIEALSHERARQEAEQVHGGSKALGEEVQHSEARANERARRERLQGVIDGLERMTSLASELREELDTITPKATRPSGERRKSSSRLSKRQQRLERAVTELEQQLESVDQTLPGLGESLHPAMEAAKKAMRSASEELGEVRPGDAAGHQRQAMDKLGAMKKAIDKRLQDASGRGGGGAGIHRRDQRVEIPDADEQGSPKALRDALLKAMKERAPERYEGAIERYYEELVR